MATANPNHLPDLTRGTPLDLLRIGGHLVGLVGKERVLLWWDGSSAHALAADCPHLGGPLADGLFADGKVHCPWHHACFDLRTGAALAAPAFDALKRFEVRIQNDTLFVGGPVAPVPRRKSAGRHHADPIVIVGGGAAGYAAANSIRTSGWSGEISVFSADQHAPYDRTLLTKDYLDGHFGDDRLPIAGSSLDDLGVCLQTDATVEALDVHNHSLQLRGGDVQRFSKLLLATGAEPCKPDFPGVDLPHVKCLRSLQDCRQIIATIEKSSRVVVLGGSFIALEAAASIRTRDLTVDVVSEERHPLRKILGHALSELVVATHRDKGVRFHLGRKIASVANNNVTLDDGNVLECDLLVVGIGVQPRIDLAKQAGMAIDRGVIVDSHLRTSARDIYAAGDIARWPDPHTNEAVRVEHWVVAQRQGAIAGANMVGAARPFEMVPFFWTKHFDLAIRYVGHAQDWDEDRCDGVVAERDVTVRYFKAGRELAVATVGRDLQSLEAEREMTRRLPQRRRVGGAN